ncbi:hypothetical protein LTR22_027993 [Elasticomyces elasticus]|nr:hypothetical protein LTR22_027993 [Elasticomyces elasticus]KAK5732623.1 hypothetical protein LTS12_027097 [Elasticomyces elasticus]
MFFERETSEKLDEPVRDQIKRYIEQKLRPKFQLSLKPKEKPTLQWEDLHLILYFHIRDDTYVYTDERMRLQIHLTLLLAAFTGQRSLDPESEAGSGDETTDPGVWKQNTLLYRDLELGIASTQRAPKGELILYIRFRHTKGDELARHNDKTVWLHLDNELIWCPLTAILSLAWADKAFEHDFEHPDKLLNLRIDLGDKSTTLSNASKPCWRPIRWREDILDTPILRESNAIDGTANDPLRYTTAARHIRSLSIRAGFEQEVGLYYLRRASANNLDRNVTASERNKIMDHSHNRVYERYYGDNHIVSDMQASYREQVPEVIRRATKLMRLRHDHRAPTSLTSTQIDACRDSPSLQQAQTDREAARSCCIERYGSVARASGTKEGIDFANAKREYMLREAALKRETLKELRRHHYREAERVAIQRQLDGDDEVSVSIAPAELVLAPRKRMADRMCRSNDSSAEEHPSLLRSQHILDGAELCAVRERPMKHKCEDECYSDFEMLSPPPKRISGDSNIVSASELQRFELRRLYVVIPAPVDSADATATTPMDLEPSRETPLHDNIHPLQCFLCYHEQGPSRSYKEARQATLWDHMDKWHYACMAFPYACPHPACKSQNVFLQDADHLRNHLERVHRVVSRRRR